MAKSGLKHIDVGAELTKTEWESEESHTIINGTAFPASPVERQLFYRNDLHEWYIYNGTAWVSLQGAGGGGGDMLKSVYDTNDNGIVDNSEKLEGSTKLQVQDHTPKAHTLASHSTKAHSELTGVTTDQHHAKTVSSEIDHGSVQGLADDDHPQYIKHSLATAVSDFLVASGAGVFVKKTLAQVKTLLNWAADIATHAALSTGVHGAGSHTFGYATSAEITLYVDAGSGNDSNPGTSGSPKATIKGALDALPAVIAHAVTICVRGQQNYPENNAALEFTRFSTLAPITIKAVNSSDEEMYDNGKAESGGNTTLTDTDKSWTTNRFANAYIWIHHGTGKGQIRQIASNTATQITVTAAWTINPDNTSYYAIGGGAVLTGTALYHIRNTGKLVDIYGFRHTGATLMDLRVDNFGALGVFYNCCPSSVRGIGVFSSLLWGDPQYNYINATTVGVDVSALAYATVRGNVINGAAKGIRIYYEAMVAGSSTVYRQNHIMNCTTGISIESGSGMTAANAQSFGAGGDANITDIDPTPSSEVPQWYT